MKKAITVLLLIFLICACTQKENCLTILHTNDTHSHIETEKNGNGGALNRALLIEQLRDSIGKDNVLLLDCGDFSQGSLYYNIYKGAFEIDIMNAIGYDAGTIGNHEFDFGMENLANLVKRAKFPFVCANYDFTGTPCEGVISPYIIIERGGNKIGIFGLSPNPEGLVLKENYKGVKFISPIDATNRCVEELRKQHCDIVVCLSHLGWKINNEYNDERLATETSGVDIILGGHSHDYFEEPKLYKNKEGKEVLMQQAGKYGRYLGEIKVTLE